MFKLNAYSTGKLPLPLCLCGNSIRIIADATVGRALTSKRSWLPQGGRGAALALLAPSPLQHLWASREVKAEGMCYSDNCTSASRAQSSGLPQESRLPLGGAEGAALFPSERCIVQRPCNRVACYTQFCSSVPTYMIRNDSLTFKLQIPFPTNLVFPPKEGAGE